MNKQKHTSTRRLTKEAIKGRFRIEKEASFPTYMVVLSRDKNDEIMIIPPNYPKTIENSSSRQISIPESIKMLPGDKPIHKIVRKNIDKSEVFQK